MIRRSSPSGKANDIDPVCTIQGNLVEAIKGVAVLTGAQDTDLRLAGNLPFIWNRQYCSVAKLDEEKPATLLAGMAKVGVMLGAYNLTLYLLKT